MASDEGELVFVYGTLREGHQNLGRDVLTTHGRLIGEGKVPGRLHDLGAFPALVRAEDDQPRVRGEVYELVNEPERGLARLDRYEGAEGTDPLPYERRRLEVQMDDGRRLRAWTYLWVDDIGDAPRVESGDWVEHVAGNERR